MTFNSPEEFVNALKKPAFDIEREYGIPALFVIAQAALESGWGKNTIGNNLFGIKAGNDWNGLKRLVVTTEYSNCNNLQYPEILKIEKKGNLYKYTVKDWFRDYETLEEGLLDHVKFLLQNKRYEKAFKYTDAKKFAKEIAKAGYATDPNYYYNLYAVIDSVKKRL